MCSVLVLASVTHWLGQVSPEKWSAVAAGGTFLVALIASFVAARQLGEARRLRKAQGAPYVVVYMDRSPAASWIVDLVVKNFGTTAATDVQLEIEPTPRRSAGASIRDVPLPGCIPVLVPGQEWRTLWDSGLSRHDSDLEKRHEAVVTFVDSEGQRSRPYRFTLDWDQIYGREMAEEYTVHDAAKALREISKTVAAWKESGGGLAVIARDGDAKDARTRDEMNARRARREAAAEVEDPSRDEDRA
jgi:hypothetical protein